jgi:GcrA cell cycle regulator
MNWTDERVEQLKKLWAEGLSASQIAAQLGGVSRNAVIGKVHRLKLSGRGKTTSSQTRSKKVNTAVNSQRSGATVGHMSSRVVNRSVGATALQAEYSTEIVPHTITRTVTDVVVPISRRLELVQLSERTCKWPVGDPLQPDFNFCGNDVGEGGPYCTYHARLAYQPASDRRRSR